MPLSPLIIASHLSLCSPLISSIISNFVPLIFSVIHDVPFFNTSSLSIGIDKMNGDPPPPPIINMVVDELFSEGFVLFHARLTHKRSAKRPPRVGLLSG